MLTSQWEERRCGGGRLRNTEWVIHRGPGKPCTSVLHTPLPPFIPPFLFSSTDPLNCSHWSSESIGEASNRVMSSMITLLTVCGTLSSSSPSFCLQTGRPCVFRCNMIWIARLHTELCCLLSLHVLPEWAGDRWCTKATVSWMLLYCSSQSVRRDSGAVCLFVLSRRLTEEIQTYSCRYM